MKTRTVFGINVRAARRANELSQEKLAEVCHLHRNYIGSVERAERNVSIDSMERIAAGLGASVADLLRIDSESNSAAGLPIDRS